MRKGLRMGRILDISYFTKLDVSCVRHFTDTVSAVSPPARAARTFCPLIFDLAERLLGITCAACSGTSSAPRAELGGASETGAGRAKCPTGEHVSYSAGGSWPLPPEDSREVIATLLLSKVPGVTDQVSNRL